MLILNRKPGERVILQTASGRVVISLLGGQQVGIELPPGVEVVDGGSNEKADARGGRSDNWLPSRPSRVTG